MLPLTYFYLPKSARAYLFPQSVKTHYFCSGPVSVGPICPQPKGSGEEEEQLRHRGINISIIRIINDVIIVIMIVMISFIASIISVIIIAAPGFQLATWLRTNGVNTNGAAAKVMNFDRLGEKVRPGTFGKIKVG